MHHRTIQINQPTRCNNFSVYYPDVYLQLNMFPAFSRPSSGAQWLQWQPLVLSSYRGDSRAVFVVGPAPPRTQHGYHHDTKVKPEAATAVIELLMMAGKTPETCWAVNKRQDNKPKKLLHQVGDLFEQTVSLWLNFCCWMGTSNAFSFWTSQFHI